MKVRFIALGPDGIDVETHEFSLALVSDIPTAVCLFDTIMATEAWREFESRTPVTTHIHWRIETDGCAMEMSRESE